MHWQCIAMYTYATPGESESDCSDADDNSFEYALRAKDRLEKAEFLEVRTYNLHNYSLSL